MNDITKEFVKQMTKVREKNTCDRCSTHTNGKVFCKKCLSIVGEEMIQLWPFNESREEKDIHYQMLNILTWQVNDSVHPLTCGNDSNHRNLIPAVENVQVILKCLDCEYTQTFIPDIVMEGI